MTLEETKKNEYSKALKAAKWNIVKACESLGVSRATLYRAILKYGIKRFNEKDH